MTLSEYLEIHPKTHLIFDFDETLFWLVLEWDRFFEAMEKELASIDRGLYDDLAASKRSLSGTLNSYVEAYGTKAKQIITNMSVRFEEEHLARVVPNPELVDFVMANRDRFSMSIWTSNTSKVVEKVLAEHGLTGVFARIASQLEILMLKPYPDGFRYLAQSGVSKDRYLMIGNSSADEEAAKAAGIDYFHIDYFTKRPQAD